MSSSCSGECCICGCGDACLAGHGDDDYFPASKEQVIERLESNQYNSYVREMKSYLLDKYGYDYDSDHCNHRDIVGYFNGNKILQLWKAQNFILKLIYGLPLSDDKSLFLNNSSGDKISNAISEKEYRGFI